MPLDSFIDSFRNRFKRPATRLDRPSTQELSTSGDTNGPGRAETSPRQRHGHFHNAHNFVLNNPTMAETINYMISTGKTVLEHLLPYTMPDAAMDSSARYPPPTCHPGTRLYVGNKLKDWLYDTKRQWCMIWLHGPAGTGKSAVAQTFAERCAVWGRLGAAYFFSRTHKRNKLETVVPSLVYQLAVAVPEYKNIITTVLSNDPQLLEKAPPVQFRRLVIQPFSVLLRQRPREPVVIILDGLDECKGEDSQLEIIDMVTEATRLYPDLPLLWLVCSRPEMHLKRAFSRVGDCGREELIIDAECRDDVERYLRHGVIQIKARYGDITPSYWPSEDQLGGLFGAVSGLFVLASTALKYVGDPVCADPVGQLEDLATFLYSARVVGSSNPLAALDLLYMRILDDIPPKVFPTTLRILAYFIAERRSPIFEMNSAQAVCNFLRLDQHVFYAALRGLHAVLEIPEPEAAIGVRLRFHHVSFEDFLLHPSRSGKFVIDKQKALIELAKSTLFWYDIDLTHFHTNDGWDSLIHDEHDSLPGLTWTSPDNKKCISEDIACFVDWNCWDIITGLSPADVDDALISRIDNFDFRYVRGNEGVRVLTNLLYSLGLLDTLVRTEASSPTDFQLLEYLQLVIANGTASPAMFPLEWYCRPWTREYFFIGRGIKSAIVWITESDQSSRIHVLNIDQKPTAEMISRYRTDLEDIGWEESKVVRRIGP